MHMVSDHKVGRNMCSIVIFSKRKRTKVNCSDLKLHLKLVLITTTCSNFKLHLNLVLITRAIVMLPYYKCLA